MKSDFLRLKHCLACESDSLQHVLDLGEQPLANSYHDNNKDLPVFPLALNMCPVCFHAQQEVAVNPDLMFKDYAYVSGTSETLRKYFKDFVSEVASRVDGGAQKSVLDIACNDGSQLVPFIEKGWEAYGVDPAENLIDRAQATGATVLCEYWTDETSQKFNRTFDAVIAQNVFAHVADPFSFLTTCKKVMHDGSKLFIQTSQADMIPNGEFDTIYHEHISFFSTRSMQTLAARAGLTLEEIFITSVHGGSYVFVLGYGPEKTSVRERIEHEEKEGRYSTAFFEAFANKAKSAVDTLKKTVAKYKEEGYVVAGYGAAAKGNTLLNFGSIGLDFIVDDNPLKHGLYTPGMDILIFSPDHLKTVAAPMVIVPLAWNFYDEIYKKVKMLRGEHEDIFVTYFPSVEIRT